MISFLIDTKLKKKDIICNLQGCWANSYDEKRQKVVQVTAQHPCINPYKR